jgi:hypothetical protein
MAHCRGEEEAHVQFWSHAGHDIVLEAACLASVHHHLSNTWHHESFTELVASLVHTVFKIPFDVIALNLFKLVSCISGWIAKHAQNKERPNTLTT